MHGCFFGTKSTQWPSFLSRGGRRGSVERLVVVGKNSWQAGGIFSQLAGLPAPTGGRLLLQTPPWQKNRGRLSRFQTVAIDARPWSQGLGGLNDQGADRKEGKNNLPDFTTHHFLSPLILFSAPAPPTSLLPSGCGRYGRVLLLSSISPLTKLKLRPLGADDKVHKAIE